MDWSKYPNFSKHEFDCSHTGENKMMPEFMDFLQSVRTEFGNPMSISSGYRDKTHPIEARKSKPGEHAYGCAADIRVSYDDAYDLVAILFARGVKRIGVHQKGDGGRFIHIGLGDKLIGSNVFPPKRVWSY